MNSPYDFLVLGGGSAGYAAARTALDHGLSVAVVDGARELGGLCILRGCMPSKTLIESSNRLRAMRRAKEFGLRAEGLEAKVDEIVARKRRLIGEFADYRAGQLSDGRFDLFRGKASFIDPHRVAVQLLEDGSPVELEFRCALVATGSEVRRLDLPGLAELGSWTSDELLDAEHLPDRFIVLGGGAIALEMACYLEGLGRRVTVLQRGPQVLSGTDPDIAAALERALRSREDFELFTDTQLLRVEAGPQPGEKTVVFTHRGEERRVVADEILQALGRRPATGSLDADAAGIELQAGSGRVVCGFDQRTSAEHIFAAGDVCGPHEVVHIAIAQGEIAAWNAARHLGRVEGPSRQMDYRLKLLGIFTDPPLATVGLSEAEAREAGREVACATYPFDDHGKSMVMGETDGLVKMMVDCQNGEIIGASVVGPEAVEIIHELVVAMHFRATASEFLKIPHYHPTLSEIWTYPAEDLSIYG